MLLLTLSLFALATQAAPPTPFPALEGETLLGEDFRLPKDFGTAPTWLVIGFTKNSQKATDACATKLEERFKGQGYSVAILQGAPFFLKGVIKNGIRKYVPPDRQSRYLILNEGRELLKNLAGFEEGSQDDAYVVGFRAISPTEYPIQFSSHGACDPSHFMELTQKIQTLIAPKKAPATREGLSR